MAPAENAVGVFLYFGQGRRYRAVVAHPDKVAVVRQKGEALLKQAKCLHTPEEVRLLGPLRLQFMEILETKQNHTNQLATL